MIVRFGKRLPQQIGPLYMRSQILLSSPKSMSEMALLGKLFLPCHIEC